MKAPKEATGSGLMGLGIITAAIFCVVSILLFNGGGQLQKPLFQADTWYVSQGWADGVSDNLTLPAKLKYPENGKYVLRATLTPPEGTTLSPKSILFSAKYLNVHIYLDDEEIGSCLCKLEGQKKTGGKVFTIFSLPDGYAGRELRIEAQPLLGMDMEYDISAPIIASGGELVYSVIYNELPVLLTVSATFLIGVILLLFSFQALKINKGTFLQTGLFAIVFALYTLSITNTVHLFVSNSVLLYTWEFLLLALIPLPLLALVNQVFYPQFKRLLLADIIVAFANFSLQAIFYLFTDIELRDMVHFTHILMIVSVLLVLPLLISGHRHGTERIRLVISFSPILIGSMSDLCRFYLPGSYEKALGFQLGVLLFIFLQISYLIHSYFAFYRQHLETDIYKRMAYTDVLTGLANRAAFEKRISDLTRTRRQYVEIWCVCADVNNLKLVNDTQGHAMGDALIRASVSILQMVMCESSELYRTGGDEFVMFIFNRTERDILDGRSRFEKEVARFNAAHSIQVSVALGCDRLRMNDADDSITSLISRADSLMYEDKRRYKSANN